MLVKLVRQHRARVHELRHLSETRLKEMGLKQFHGPGAQRARGDLDRHLDAGEFYGWVVDDTVEAVAAMTDVGDPMFWTVSEWNQPGVRYLCRFMSSGNGHGEHLLAAVLQEEREHGVREIRLDCWKDNIRLHEYYLENGFEQVRIMDVPGRDSGALFRIIL